MNSFSLTNFGKLSSGIIAVYAITMQCLYYFHTREWAVFHLFSYYEVLTRLISIEEPSSAPLHQYELLYWAWNKTIRTDIYYIGIIIGKGIQQLV